MAQGKIPGSVLTGPLRTKDARAGANAPLGRQATITLTAQAAGTPGTYTISDVNALAADVVCVSPVSAPQAGVTSIVAWCAVDGTISVKINNGSASALTAGPMVVAYTLSK